MVTSKDFKTVGKRLPRVDALKLAVGKGTFTDDIHLPGMLYAKILFSPHAHARIKDIDTIKAKQLPGVHAVLTYKDVKRVPYTTAGQGFPEPSPYDTVMLDSKVRFVGDRVAVVAAESAEIAERALELIDVEYEILPAIFDPRESMEPGSPIIHDEIDSKGIHDASKNIAAHVHAEVGDIEEGFEQSDVVVEKEYSVHYVQQSSIEPHVSITWLDEDNRLVVRTSTQVPFHVRRIIAPLLGIPVRRIRVIKPRIGGGFGGKQEILIEDLCGALTLATGCPVKLEYTREEELSSARTRHPQIIKMKTGLMNDGKIVAMEMTVLENTGAYGTHALTVQSCTGSRPLPLYRIPNLRFEATAVYTNLPIAGAFRGYGAPQGFFAMECHIDELAEAVGMEAVEFRKKNLIQPGDAPPILEALGEGKEGFKQTVKSYGLDDCIRKGMEAIDWERKRREDKDGIIKRGVGIACLMHASGIPGVDMGAASIKMNEDASFNVLVGATDLGTGSDTMIAQIAAEELAVSAEKIIVYSSDTDFTPFDTGAYASSTTFISGGAVKKAAEKVKRQIIEVAGRLLQEDVNKLRCEDATVVAESGKTVSYEKICLSSLYAEDQFQIMANSSHMSYDSPPPFGAQFAEVEVDTETGLVRVLKLVSVMDCGIAINPPMAEGQIEGGAVQSMGYALTEEMPFDEKGRMVYRSFKDYNIYSAIDMPEMETILVETYEPTGPFGAKAIAEIPIDGIAPAIANAIYNATGVRLRDLPFTPEKVLKGVKETSARIVKGFEVLGV